MKKLNVLCVMAALCVVFLAGAARGQATSTPQRSFFKRPVPWGVSISNIQSVVLFNNLKPPKIACEESTLGALVQDQSANQYVLTAGHAINQGPTALVTSGAIVQPGLSDTPYPSGEFSACFQKQANTIANYTLVVGAPGSTDPTADAGIAKIVAGDVGTSVYSVGPVGGTPLIPRKRMKVQKVGIQTGATTANVLVETGRRVFVDYCTGVGGASRNCLAPETVEYFDQDVIKQVGFAAQGDSGALVITKGSCPQPIGIVFAGNGSVTAVSPISDVFAQLQAAGGYNLNIVSGCSTSSADQAQNSETDPDVAAAEAAIAQEGSVWLSATGVVAVMVDMSVTPAAIDIECANQAYADLLPASFHNSFNGIPIEYTVEETLDQL